MSFRKYIMALSCATLLGACSSTVSSDDDEIISEKNIPNKNNSSSSTAKKDKSSSSVKEPEEECLGEPGKPWDGTTAKDFACGAGTKLSPYVILTAEQLAKLSFIVGANDKNYQGKYYKLGADILLNDGKIIDDKGALVADSSKLHKWTPIGNSSVAFTGTFDGDGHTVRGMFINTTSSHNGLFGNSSGTIENLTVADSWVMGKEKTAGIVGNNTGTLKKLINKASVTSTKGPVGGVVGSSNDSYGNTNLVDSVYNFGVIKGSSDVGGILGYIDRIKLSNA